MLERVLIIVAVLAVASLAYLWWQRRQGKVTHIDDAEVFPAAGAGIELAARATFIQFSTPTCARCPGTRRLLHQVADGFPGVGHAEVDAIERLDLADRFNVVRTPTILVVDGAGYVRARMSGPPSREDAIAALDEVPPVDYSI